MVASGEEGDPQSTNHQPPASHVPVMVSEVLAQLEPSRGGLFVDCTVGLGGHTRALLDAGASRVIGIDRDPAAIAIARESLSGYGDRVDMVHADYRSLPQVLDARGVAGVAGVLADLGVSSLQLDSPERGFSFRRDEPLDMRMDTSRGATAAEMLIAADEQALADVIYEFGEERHARRVARAIVAARADAPLESTGRFADIVRRAIPRKGYSRIDPATRTFQAVRIWVNRELEGLDRFLAQAAGRLDQGGRLVVITFHSLEDRIVKHTFRTLQSEGRLAIRTKRPTVPGEAEIDRNPRARSAKLRAAERPADAGVGVTA
jgi:16S rRNA (cytosine1402-N4)-methyltransferase